MHRHFSHFFGREHGCAGRHGHDHGVGGFMGGFMGGFRGRGDFGGHGFRSGRKLGSEDLQLLILALLADKPSHGYELIKSLEERSGGFYSPSPGMIYPALTYLEEIGYARVEADGAKKLVSITDEGKAHLASRKAAVDTIFAQLRWIGEKMQHVRRVFSGEGADNSAGPDAGSIFGDSHRRGLSPELREARTLLKAALVAKRGSSPEEQKRIATILKQAADAIAGE
jgi:DNA-binding PadR family transcriptional regulator